jgi:DNA helicase-2/ATP-dependent DNA helicase PcrA
MYNEELFLKEYEKLNARQREVVDTIDGPVMVVAGPGTGKTQVLGLRVANIIRKTEVGPGNILCLTYTDAGAYNMRDRLKRFIGNDAYRVEIGTFHSFCNNVISHYPEYFHDAVRFSAAGPLEKAEIERELFANLPYGHAFYGKTPAGDYTYRRDVLARIENIKKAGFTPLAYKESVEGHLGELGIFSQTFHTWPAKLAIKDLGAILEIANELADSNTESGTTLAKSLTRAIEASHEIGKTEPLGKWKKDYLVKNESDMWMLKELDPKRMEKIRAVAELYGKYEEALHGRERYDFSDMIIDVAEALKNNSVLRSELEEQYQYILLDEFQDTNDAQMSLVRALTSSPIHEGRPNVMAVGDDDQAIFKFQGAELSNILSFKKSYRDVAIIVLDTNYRSHENILSSARKVVVQGEYRLENQIEGLSKVLTQGNKGIIKGDVFMKQFNTDSEEYAYVADTISKLVDEGVDAGEIAIIARDHKDLQATLLYLNRAQVPYIYERSANVFEERHVSELVTFCAYVASAASDARTRDELLPTILMSPYWGLDRTSLFRFAVKVKESGASWSGALLDSTDENIKRAGRILAESSSHAESEPLEHLLERFMTESGFREYYFSERARKDKAGEYYVFLASLKTFIEALRSWRDGEKLFARDVEPFVKLHRDFGINLTSKIELAGGAKAVRILSAHSSKGLEFDTVFLLKAHQGVWVKKKRGSKAPVPLALEDVLTPAGDDPDDVIRLLYVAMTRAKSRLYITAHEDLVEFLGGESGSGDTTPDEGEGDEEDIDQAESFLFAPPFIPDEKVLIAGILEKWRLSVTHLNNFCNVETGGPEHFVAQNLLRIPQPMSASLVYGSAVDEALTEFISYPRYHGGEAAPLEHLLKTFTRVLARGRLPREEEVVHRDRGEKVVANFATRYASRFGEEDEAQVDFRGANIAIEGVPITGKIDLLTLKEGGYFVTDFKTGKPLSDWKPKDENKKIQAYHYKHQLGFYALLLKYSGRHNFPIRSLVLEFVDELHVSIDSGVLEYFPTEEELVRLEKLIAAVGKKILSLDFPNVEHYPKTLKGIIAFEDDLIEGNI